MKKNYFIALFFMIVCFAALIVSIVFYVKEESVICSYVAVASCGLGFLSVLFGLGSWKEKK